VKVQDFTFFAALVSAVFWQSCGLVYWYLHPGSFNFSFLVLGCFGSCLQVIGGISLNLSLAKSKEAGPPLAVISCQMIVLTVVAALVNGHVPTVLQLVGLAFGLLGMLILVVPDHMRHLLQLR
jgi:drug/metabolite transporter (DMT)-like permease